MPCAETLYVGDWASRLMSRKKKTGQAKEATEGALITRTGFWGPIILY